MYKPSKCASLRALIINIAALCHCTQPEKKIRFTYKCQQGKIPRCVIMLKTKQGQVAEKYVAQDPCVRCTRGGTKVGCKGEAVELFRGIYFLLLCILFLLFLNVNCIFLNQVFLFVCFVFCLVR